MKTLNIINEYIGLDELYESKYDKYIVLLQVGSFYEIYSIIKDDPKLIDISNKLNILLTKKNKSIERISKSNPALIGFPCISLYKFLDILLDNNYIVIVYNQHGETSVKTRKLDKIYTRASYISTDEDLKNTDNYICCIYLEHIKDKYICGISIINILTGDVQFCEFYNNIYEELNKLLIIFNITELIFLSNDRSNNISITILNQFKNDDITIHTKYEYLEQCINIQYQTELLQLLYSKTNFSLLTPIEYFNLEFYNNARNSLIIVLHYLYDHDNSLINLFKEPVILYSNSYLNIHNNALYQLNVLSSNSKYKINSLYQLINKTSTHMGFRYLLQNISKPLCDINELNYRYTLIEKLLQKRYSNFIYQEFVIHLDKILDIEKYHNKLCSNKLLPSQYGKLNNSYLACLSLIKLSKNIFTNFDFDKLSTFHDYYNNYITIFNIENLQIFNYNNSNLENFINIFNDNINVNIDNAINEINQNKKDLMNIANSLSELINGDKIDIKYTDRDGYFLVITKTRATKLKKILENIDINMPTLTFENKTQNHVYINSSEIKQLSFKCINNQSKLSKIMNEEYIKHSYNLYIEYQDTLLYLNKFISYVDLIVSNTICSNLYNYNKPIINFTENKSFINCKNLRHPIIEQIQDTTEFISNDININTNYTGYLLYGINGSGKSTIMKAVGLNIILAQIGCYTASKYFEYSPYYHLFTRIEHSDNIFKGQSSFETEIIELKSIFNYSNSNSLILGDEILNSTENISALSLISASINHFLKNDISFIFASHNHDVPKYIEPSLLEKLFICHLQTDYDEINKCFIYNRKLYQGESIKNYGLIVAKSLLANNDIINDALKIQNKILNIDKLSIKQSKYNAKLLMTNCYICKDLNIKLDENAILETHHITFQQHFNNNKCNIIDKEHIKKNNKYNLVNLCKKHHIDVHNEKIIINKWIETTNGLKLEYTIKN